MTDCVVTLINSPAGKYEWYLDFPARLSEELKKHRIEHIIGFRHHGPESPVPEQEQLSVHDVFDAPDLSRLRKILEPRLGKFERVILHTHSYSFGDSKFRKLVNENPNWKWWSTVHRTPRSGKRFKKAIRLIMSRRKIVYPDQIFGCSETCTSVLKTLFPADMIGALVNGRLSETQLNNFEKREEPNTAIFVGRLVNGKGIWIALEAAKLIFKRRNDFKLIVVGDGPEWEHVKDWVRRESLEKEVTLCGYQFDVEPYYRAADLIWIPTIPEQLSEGMGLVALEAQGHAIPSIYTSSGGLPETQVENETGLLMDPVNAQTLANHTLELFENPQLYNDMRAKICLHRNQWSVDRMVREYINAYITALTSETW